MDVKSENEVENEELGLECNSYDHDSQIIPDGETNFASSSNINFEELDETVPLESELREIKEDSMLDEEQVNNDVIKPEMIVEKSGSQHVKIIPEGETNFASSSNINFEELDETVPLESELREMKEDSMLDEEQVNNDVIKLEMIREKSSPQQIFSTLQNVCSLSKKIAEKNSEVRFESDEEEYFRNLLRSKFPSLKRDRFIDKEIKIHLSSDESEVDDVEIEAIHDGDEHEESIPNTLQSDEVEDLPAPSEPSTSRTGVSRRKRFKREEMTLEECIHTLENRNYTAKNGHIWSTHPFRTGQRRISNTRVPDFESKPTRITKQAKTILECFQLFFDNVFFSNLVTYTNRYIKLVCGKYKSKGHVAATNLSEMKAFIGILILSAVKKDNHVAINELWNPKIDFGQYRMAMSVGRFNFLLRCIRFDDAKTRAQRAVNDKFAPIRDLWDLFISKCTANYEPGEYITIDEQLLGFRGKCSFRQYIPNKPAKYGIKLVMACDAQTNYMLNSIPYLGRHTKPPKGMLLGEYFTKELVKPYYGSRRSVTTDNWFTSYSLAQSLLENDLTICGTLRVKPYVPKEMLDLKARKTHTSAFLYDSSTTLVSYKPKDKKIVLLLSTVHKEGNIGIKRKPVIVEHYNKTKGGVDTLDQMCSTYSCNRKTKSWPLCVFYGILNIGTINAYTIFNYKRKANSKKAFTRRQFMHQLAMDLIRENAVNRLSSKSLSTELRSLIRRYYSIPKALASTPTLAKYVRCRKCDSKLDRKTKHVCADCKEPICLQHAYWVCCECLQ